MGFGAGEGDLAVIQGLGVGLVGARGVGLGLERHPNRAVVLQPGGIAIRPASDGQAGIFINFTHGGKGLEGSVGEVGAAATTVDEMLGGSGGAGLGDQGRCFADGFHVDLVGVEGA